MRLHPHDYNKAAYLLASPPNNRTVRSVAHSLQDGGLASICTSYNEDSEVDLWERTEGLSCAHRGNRLGVDLW